MAGVEKSAGKASSDPGWVIPRWWEETADAIAYDSSTCPPPITLVCGPGNSGKSTFSRLLLNTLLPRYKRVGYLDTDVGQPEFTTPGCVSLHIIDKQTPDLTILYLKTPERMGERILIKKDARMIRDVRLVAYFRQCLPRHLDISSYQELVHSLASIPPHGVPLRKIKVQHLHCEVSRSKLYHGLEATVVGLAISSWVPAPSEYGVPWCVGLGFVRAVDFSKETLYLITPVPRNTLEKVDLLLRGSIEIPTCLLQGCGSSSPFMSRNVPQNLEQLELDEHIARLERQLSELLFH